MLEAISEYYMFFPTKHHRKMQKQQHQLSWQCMSQTDRVREEGGGRRAPLGPHTRVVTGCPCLRLLSLMGVPEGPLGLLPPLLIPVTSICLPPPTAHADAIIDLSQHALRQSPSVLSAVLQ